MSEGLLYICGDFNSRCGSLDDFIRGVDVVSDRQILDLTLNKYGELFIDLLINMNMCMLNGRSDPLRNGFTSVSTKGCSVVDYCAVSYDKLQTFDEFQVVTVTELVNQCNQLGHIVPSVLPDHSMLSWCIHFDTSIRSISQNAARSNSHVKFDVKSLPNDFMLENEVLNQVYNTIDKLETGYRTQTDIDSIYDDWCSIVSSHMYDKLPFKHVGYGVNNKRRKPGKPWWSDQLTVLWNDVCTAEKCWLKCSNGNRKYVLKSTFVHNRKLFDREVQRAKRLYWYTMQSDLLNECKVDSQQFWKSIGKIGVNTSSNSSIPMEVYNDDGTISTDFNVILNKWKHDFSSLFHTVTQNVNVDSYDDDDCLDNTNTSTCMYLNEPFSILEIIQSLKDVNKGKACGVDNIPVEVLNNDTSVAFMHTLFNICFSKGIMPSMWGKCIINPIPKSSSLDKRDPLSYRGISLAPSMYKLYCSILNNRLSKWSELNGHIADEQNGFRKKRSTIDHVLSLHNLIDSRKKLNKSTYCAFIDFKKAYDTINRNILWKRLNDIGVKGKMFYAVKSLYNSVMSCVRVNSVHTDWFDVKSGLRQGCILSPLLFDIFINDFTNYIKSLDIGVSVNGEKICVLLYADDIVLLAENVQDLQVLLNALNDWCILNDMNVNSTKSNIVHFRPKNQALCDAQFLFGDKQLLLVDRYKYLGVIFHENLDMNVTVNAVAQSASRALGLLIAKCKSIGGLPFDVFTKLYDTVVWPVIGYSAPLWGSKSYSCIDKVHNRAQCFFLGVGKFTPTDGVSGDLGWKPTFVRQWKCIASYWSRLSSMNDDRLNKRIAVWADGISSHRCKNWFFNVKHFLNDNNLLATQSLNYPLSNDFVKFIEQSVFSIYINNWSDRINRVNGKNGKGGNKLRFYNLFKQSYETESYCKMILPLNHRSAFSKFRCGVAPIRLETGRYEGLKVEERLCPFCNVVEDEIHVFLKCPVYNDLRSNLFDSAFRLDENFLNLTDVLKCIFLFSNDRIIRCCAKTCYLILNKRYLLLNT